MLPPLPPWEGLHPLVVHFPIALLLVAPLFIVLGMILPRHAAPFSVAALILLALGSIASFVAVASGEAAAQVADRTPQITEAIEKHGDLGEDVRLIFSILTALWAAVLVVPKLVKRPLKRKHALVVSAVFLLLWAGGAIVLAHAAYRGGRLVHEFGVRSLM